ncbi:MAG: hypothetical protein IJR89_03590 [Clostridia bacterium]|nr:hypothetical protein [Clostridia bacterium]
MKKKLLPPTLFAALAALAAAIQAFLPGGPLTAAAFSLAGAIPLCLLFGSALFLAVFLSRRARPTALLCCSAGFAAAALICEALSYLSGRFDAVALALILISLLPFLVFFTDALARHKTLILSKTFSLFLFAFETVGVVVILAEGGLSALLGHPRFLLFLLSLAFLFYYFRCIPRAQKLEPLEDLPLPGEGEEPVTRDGDS